MENHTEMIKYILGLYDASKYNTVKKYLEDQGAVNIERNTVIRTLVTFSLAKETQTLGGVEVTSFENKYIKGIVPACQAISINVGNVHWNVEKPDIILATQKFRQPSLDAIGVDHTHDFTGKGVDVFVIDTGIESHSSLPTVRRLKKFPWKDDNGHGTHVAGLIASTKFGIAYDVNLYSLKVLDKDGNGHVEQVVDAISAIIEHRRLKDYKNPAVVNMSLSTIQTMFNPITEACNLMIEEGAIAVSAAGNSGEHLDDITEVMPAELPHVITVASTNDNFELSSFSNYGLDVEISAPGEKIISCWLDDGAASLSGTSMAAPRVTAVLAALLEARGTEMTSIDDVEQEVTFFLNNASEIKEHLLENNHNPKFLEVGTILNSQKRTMEESTNEHDIVVNELKTIFPWLVLFGASAILIAFVAFMILTFEADNAEDFNFPQETQITD